MNKSKNVSKNWKISKYHEDETTETTKNDDDKNWSYLEPGFYVTKLTEFCAV